MASTEHDLDSLDHHELAELVQRATTLLIQQVLGGHGSLSALEPQTADETAAIIGITPQHVRRLCRDGKLGHFRIGGGSYSIPRATALAYLAACYHPAA